jgi:cardiolipin synthase
MSEISQRALMSVYLRNDAQIDGAEMASLIKRAKNKPDPAVSARIAEFASPLDKQVVRIVRGQIPGAETIFTPNDLSAMRRRVDLANDRTYVKAIGRTVAEAALAPTREGNDLTFHVDGAAVYPEIRRLVRSAEKTIDVEFFSFHDDHSGLEMADELAAAARKGVRVNVMLDHLGARHSTEVIARMTKAGVNVQTFKNGYKNPNLHPNSITDHRKIVLVDGKAGMTGGMNIGERYEAYWHDVMVTVKGPVLKDLYREYATNFTASGGKFPADAIALAQKNTKPTGNMDVAVHVTTPTSHQVQDGLFAAIDAAKDNIYINSPYFIDAPLIERLNAAAKRGVKVVAQIPKVGDNPLIDYLNKTRINEMLAAGVDVRSFDTKNHAIKGHDHVKDYFDHAKMATVDGVWTTIGTANADARAMRTNQEINIAVSSPEFAQTINREFFHADAVSGRVSPAPSTKFSRATYLVRAALKGISPLL